MATVKLPAGSGPTGILLSTDGAHAYVRCQGTDSIAVIDARQYALEKTIALPGEPLAWAFAANNQMVVGTLGARLVVLDLTSGEVAETFPLDMDPVGVAYAP